MKIGSLFSGYGGLDEGVRAVFPQARTVWFSEFDKGPSKILAHRFPGVPNHGDITKIDWQSVEPVDILTGGFPCQDLSHAGKRAGMVNGTRSNLWHEFVRAIAHLQPKLVVIENVRGLLSGSAEFDEPNDICVCGWPYRRGGLRADSAQQGSDLSPSGDGRDDGEGWRSAGCNAGPVRRQDEEGSCCDGEVGCCLCLDGRGGCCDTPPVGRSTALDLEGGAGADRIEGCGDPCGPTSPMGGQSDRTATLDGRGSSAVRDVEASDARAECEGADAAFDIPTGRRVTHCEACGGRVGDRSSRSLERSWMGIVLGELARIGYDARWHGLRAADVGAPHGRFRVFLIASPADAEHGAWGKGSRHWARPGSPASTREASGAGGHRVLRADRTALDLLPTPAAHDSGNSVEDHLRKKPGRTKVTSLQVMARGSLLPTRAGDGEKGGPNQSGSSGDLMLPSAVQPARWGEYTEAVRLWESLTRPSPDPTDLNHKGQPRLSPSFVEWLMGLPAGWVTDVPGITRNEALKALGNGVVPQQAAAALRLMLAAEVAA